MKRLACFILALVIVLSLGITASAASTGTITISNPTSGHTYTVYKLFDASYSAATDSVSYSIENTNPFYSRLFNDAKEPVAGNVYFKFNSTGNIEKVDGVSDENLTSYVTGLIQSTDTPAAAPVEYTGGSDTVTFSNLPYGYYVVKSTLGTVVTITSLAPDVTVIDKNESPAVQGNFTKKIIESGVPVDANNAAVGDLVRYRVTFNAPRYDGQHKLQYYTIKDIKGSALWVEFGGNHPENNISIKVGEQTLNRGCYLPVRSAADTDESKWEWHWLGNWGDVPQTRDNAQWNLIHIDHDTFHIVIPWMEGQTVEGDQSTTYTFKFPTDAAFRYPNNALVEINYCASIEPNAEVGGGDLDRNLYNKAQLNWTCSHKTIGGDWCTVRTNVHGIAIKKVDSQTFNALAGAEFEIYTDEACTNPYYVIPTDIQGVYIKDDLNAPGQQITGEHKLTARELYHTQLETYLGASNLNNGTQKNVVTSPANGKIAIIGMEAGTYYIKETKAPGGYNALSTTVTYTAGTGMRDFHVYSTPTGEVADINSETAGYIDHTYHVAYAEITNSQGLELPSTGGEGTMMMITIGTMVALVFAVLLITHKKMSVYHD